MNKPIIKLSKISKSFNGNKKYIKVLQNVNLIIKKMNRNEVFDEDAKENIHDLVLFIHILL